MKSHALAPTDGGSSVNAVAGSESAGRRQFLVSPLLGSIESLRAPRTTHRLPCFGSDRVSIGALVTGEAVFPRHPHLGTLAPDCVLVRPAGASFPPLALVGAGDYMAIGISTAQLERWLPRTHALTGHLGVVPLVVPEPALYDQLLSLQEQLANGPDDPAVEHAVRAYVATVDRWCAHHASPTARAREIPLGIAHVRSLIDREPFRRWTVREMAVAAGMGFYNFAHAFSASLGISPHSYALQQRVDAARALLRSGLPASRVAHRIGFADQSHFTRRFLSVFGLTPGEYQRAWRKLNHADTLAPDRSVARRWCA
jgi:AraC-like DNA-binding protein